MMKEEKNDYISREAAKKHFSLNFGGVSHAVIARRMLDEIPAADVIPRPRWIPITERPPDPETEVMIVCNRSGCRFIATAIYEDGTLLTEDSKWIWNDIWEYGRYDEEHDDYIIPEGWWESKWIPGVKECPVCGESKFKDLDADIWADWYPPRCPNCGAKMRENNEI